MMRLVLADAVSVTRPEKWAQVAPLLEKALEHTDGGWTLDDLLEDMCKDACKPLLIVDMANAEQIVAVFLAYPERTPRKTKLTIAFMGGEEHLIRDWIHLWEPLKLWARSLGFDQLAVYGRPGWGRVLAGVREVARAYVVELNDGQAEDRAAEPAG